MVFVNPVTIVVPIGTVFANPVTFVFTVHATHEYRINFIRGYAVDTTHRIAPSNADNTCVATALVARMIIVTHSYIGSYLV